MTLSKRIPFITPIFLHYENLSFERVYSCGSASALPLSRLCRTPKVIDPSATDFVQNNSLRCYKKCILSPSLEISRFRGYPILWNNNGESFFTFNYFWAHSLRRSPKFSAPMPLSCSCQTPMVIIIPKCIENDSCGSAPALPLSRSCRTPKVINPSVMRTTAVA